VVGIISRLGASFVFSNFLPLVTPYKNPLLLLFRFSSLLLSFLFLPKGMHA